MHPVFTHVPPNLCLSIIATVIPAAVRRAAKGGPAWPVPIIIASNRRPIGSSFSHWLCETDRQFKIVLAGRRRRHKRCKSKDERSQCKPDRAQRSRMVGLPG